MMLNSAITFPGLGLEFDPPRGFTVPGTDFMIYYYGVIIAVGLVLAVTYGLRRSKQFGLKQDDILDGVLWIVPFAIICARAYYCVFEWQNRYADDPLSVFSIRDGGLAIYGGVIGAVIGVIVFCKIRKISLPAVLDLMALGFLIGQSIGRWGNFMNREAYGAETDWFLRMGLTVNGIEKFYHPTFLYESVWNAVGFVLLHFLSKKRKYDGQIALGYAAWYGLGRTFIEGLRMDSLYLGPFRVSQLLAAVSCLAGVVTLLIMALRPHDPAKLFVNRVAAMEAAAPAAEEQPEEPDEEIPAEDVTE